VTAVIIIVVIAVGLPALAWWVARRPFWASHRARPDGDPWLDILRAHRLDPVEMRQVAAAVGLGRRLRDPRLRAAVADWAERDIRRIQQNRRTPSPLRRRSVVAGLVAALLVLAVLAWRLVGGDSGWGDLTLLTVPCLLAFGALVGESMEVARLRGVVRRNTDAAAGEGAR
jgi:hypothetical protein